MHQPVLDPLPAFSRFTWFDLDPDASVILVREALADLDPAGIVVGVGEPLARLLGRDVPGLRPFPALAGPGIAVPSTQAALMVRADGDGPGTAMLAMRRVEQTLVGALHPVMAVDAFDHAGRDLTGYADGTENPKGQDAADAAIAEDGSTFVAVQIWEHDLDAFEMHDEVQQDLIIGRTLAGDEELDDAPPSSHVKRTAQESFSPPAFVLRRSMAWSDGEGHGLVFVAFGRSLDAYEALLRRMVGLDDGITDALFRFSRPLTGGYYWCPPVVGGAYAL